MKTRYSSLVTLKKNNLDKSQREVQRAYRDLHNADEALNLSYENLQRLSAPNHGTIRQLQASRIILQSQRELITHNQEWVTYAMKQLQIAQEVLKTSMIEYEKFKYLEHEEVKKILKQQKNAEVKELDEIASITFHRNTNTKKV